MIILDTALGPARIVEELGELPDLQDASILYRDVETANNGAGGGLNPWMGDRNCGVAVTVDEIPGAWYVPYRHTSVGAKNLPPDKIIEWLKDQNKIPAWVNHNIKFDQAFLYHDSPELDYPGRMIDTVVMAKMVDSDRLNYSLKPLCREWCTLPMEEEIEVRNKLVEIGKHKKIKKAEWSYSDIPIDILGKYACMDAMGNRELYHWMERHMPDDMRDLWDTEVKLTAILWDMEGGGLKIDPEEISLAAANSSVYLNVVENEIVVATNSEFVDSSKHLYDVMCIQQGLPIIATTQKGGPSFSTATLKEYLKLPELTEDQQRIVKLVSIYREEKHFKGLFLDPYYNLQGVDKKLHASYNQLVRTGRMSGRNPNMQQLNKRAKQLIKPDEGCEFGSWDASQIEFRMIVHYIKDVAAIEAYEQDKNTDFHQWVADLCGVSRKAAKTLNFAMAYGAGKRKIIEQLKTMDSDADAAKIYRDYHERLPGIKVLSDQAAMSCKKRGYVYNAFGRRRHLPTRASHKAFNSVVQGCAMDYVKDRMVALSPRYNDRIKAEGIRMAANVHDDITFCGQFSPEIKEYITETLEYQAIPFRVPFTWDSGFSNVNWAEASG